MRGGAQLQDLVDAFSDASVIVDKDLRILHYNRAFRLLVELRPRELEGRQSLCHEVLGLTSCDEGCATRRALEAGRAIRIDEVNSRDGRRRFNVTAAPLRSADGELIGIVESYRDVTEESRIQESYKELLALERRQNEQLQLQQHELDERNKELERQSRMKSQFLANMSHELRTPMNSIIGYTDLVLTRGVGLDPKAKRNLEKVLTNSQHLLEVINGILDLSKIEAGRMEVFLEPCDLAPLLETTATMASVLLNGKPVQLVRHIAEDLPQIRTDRTKLRQIVLNLLSNACKFTESGEVVLRCEAQQGRRVGDADRLLKIQVQDSGIGMPESELPFIFDEFRQIHSSETRKHTGTGLGLAIVKRMVSLLGGSISVQSQQGKGTTFTVILPVEAPARRPTLAAVPAPKIEVTDSGTDVKRLSTVIVVAAEPDSVLLVRGTLAGEPYDVVPAFTAEDAVKLAARTRPTAILFDIGSMGWEGIRQMKADRTTAGIPIVILSVAGEKAIGLALGATDYVTKPIERGVLVEKLRFLSGAASKTALVVDDDPGIRELMARMLRAEGFDVRTVSNGVEALAELERTTPDLVLLDLTMPVMDGFEVVRRMRAEPRWKNVPVMICTGKDLTADERLELQKDVARIVEKGRAQAPSTGDLLGTLRSIAN